MKLLGEKVTSVAEPTAVIIYCLDLQLPWQCAIILHIGHKSLDMTSQIAGDLGTIS